MNRRVLPADPWCLQNIQEKLSRFREELRGVERGEESDHVRKARVYSRRLRTALSLFNKVYILPDLSEVRQLLKKTSQKLGVVRDLDVQIEWLEGFIEGIDDKKLRLGLQRMLLRLQQERAIAENNVSKMLQKRRPDQVFQAFFEALQKLRIRCDLMGIKQDALTLRRLAFETLNLQLVKMMVYAPFLNEPAAWEQQHDMRIEVKRMRYAMEIFDEVYEDTLSPYIMSLRCLQAHLGALHDADVWLETIPLFVERERARTAEYYGSGRHFARLQQGLDFLLTSKNQIREETYLVMREYWAELERNNFAGSIKEHLLEWNDRDMLRGHDEKTENLPVSADGLK